MFSLNMKESSILVMSVIIELHNRIIFSVTYQQSTLTQFSSVTSVTFRQSGKFTTMLTSDLTSLVLNSTNFFFVFSDNKSYLKAAKNPNIKL